MNLYVDMLFFLSGKGKNNKSKGEVRFGRINKIKTRGKLFIINIHEPKAYKMA